MIRFPFTVKTFHRYLFDVETYFLSEIVEHQIRKVVMEVNQRKSLQNKCRTYLCATKNWFDKC